MLSIPEALPWIKVSPRYARLLIDSKEVTWMDFYVGNTKRTAEIPTHNEALEPSPAPMGSLVLIVNE